MRAVLRALDALSGALVAIAALALVGLIATSLYEVFARYVLQAPTVWSFDMINFFNGALFVLGAAYAQRNGIHVSIDIFSTLFPPRFGAGLVAVMFVLLVLPTIGLLTWEAGKQTIRFYVTARPLESAWHPLRWPFYVPLVFGLAALWLQCLATTVRAGGVAVRGASHPVPG